MKLKLEIEVPASATPDAVLSKLQLANHHGTGVTIVAMGYTADVDLIAVREVD